MSILNPADPTKPHYPISKETHPQILLAKFCKKPCSNLLFAAILNSLCTGVPLGYGLIILNNTQYFLEPDFVNGSIYKQTGYRITPGWSSILWAVIVGCQAIGAFFGCFLTVPFVQLMGKKCSLMIGNNVILIIGCVISAAAKWTGDYEYLIVGRLIAGVSTGLGSALLAVFLSDCSPPHFRGGISCLVHICIVLGTSLGAALSLPDVLGNPEHWDILLMVPVIMGMAQIILVSICPESPKDLHLRYGKTDAACQSIQYYYGYDIIPSWVLIYFEEEAAQHSHDLSFWKAVTSKEYSGRIWLAAFISFAQIFAGLMAIASYSTTILIGVGFTHQIASIMTVLGAFGCVLLALPAIWTVEMWGRRPTLIWTFLGVAFADLLLLVFGVVYQYTEQLWSGICFLLAVGIFGIAYNLGPGPIGYFITGELVPPQVRSATFALGVAVNWISTALSIGLYYPLNGVIGNYTFLLFSVPSFVAVAVLYKWLPETRSHNYNNDETSAHNQNQDDQNLDTNQRNPLLPPTNYHTSDYGSVSA